MDDLISRQAAIDVLDAYQVMVENGEDNPYAWARVRMCELPSAQTEIVRCGECVYRRRCMLQHFVESNAVDGTKIDWNEWYCADGVRDINVPSKSDGERREE